MDLDAIWYERKRRPRRRCVRWDCSSQFSVHAYCGQTAVWMKTPLGTEVDLGPGRIVLGGVPALREPGTAAPPLFDPCLLWPRSPISATAELLYCKTLSVYIAIQLLRFMSSICQLTMGSALPE